MTRDLVHEEGISATTDYLDVVLHIDNRAVAANVESQMRDVAVNERSKVAVLLCNQLENGMAVTGLAGVDSSEACGEVGAHRGVHVMVVVLGGHDRPTGTKQRRSRDRCSSD
ncbi:MAG: hypothetical protein LC797_08505 [Chloroflexi bacterium]|nr:hypothetical protein [Chloroflexota bacterium]